MSVDACRAKSLLSGRLSEVQLKNGRYEIVFRKMTWNGSEETADFWENPRF